MTIETETLHPSSAGFWDHLAHRLIGAFRDKSEMLRRARARREIRALSDRQLRDCGIDPMHAGRGKAAAVSAVTLANLQSMR